MEYTTHPTWHYKPIDVPNLEEIQEELIPVLYKEIPDFDTAIPQFKYVLRERIEPFAPKYTKFIESLGILDKWYYCGLVTINNGINFPVHVDSLNWVTRCYGLNLPLINCDDSYTVFYDAEIDGEEYTERADPINSSRRMKQGTIPTEIDRWPAWKPAWINTRIPHRPEAGHTKPRALISARFRPELHELLHK